jgi:hypothetical protein
MAALLITMREIVEKTAVCSHLLENQLPGYSIEEKVHFFNTRRSSRRGAKKGEKGRIGSALAIPFRETVPGMP